MKKTVLSFAVLALLNSLAVSAEINSQDVNNTQNVNNNGKIEVVKGKTKHYKVSHKVSNATSSNNEDRTAVLERQVQELSSEVQDLAKNKYLIPAPAGKEPPWIAYFHQHGPMIVTSPTVSMVVKEDGSDLYINMPSVNEDLALLTARQSMDEYYTKYGLVHDRPIVVLSGDLEGQVQYDRDYIDPTRISTDLTSADLEAVIEVNSWVSGLLLFSYNNLTVDYVVGQLSNLLYLNRGYITFGNLNKFPLYFTIGQFYVPFGNYANYMITTPLTQAIGKTKARAIELGFEASGFYGAVFGFNGFTFVNNSSTINNGGADLGYKFSKGKFSSEIAVSVIANIADAQGILNTPGVSYFPINPFTGFLEEADLGTNKLHKYVPAGDIFASISFDPFTLQAEYLSAFEAFDPLDLSFQDFNPHWDAGNPTVNVNNLRGAKIGALDVEGVYNFNFYTKPSFISAGYGRSWQAMALNAPEQSLFVSLSSSLLKSTREAIEYRHDINYSPSNFAHGDQDFVFFPTGRKNRDLVTLSLKFFF